MKNSKPSARLLVQSATGREVWAWADLHAAKKKLLLATTVGCVLCTAGLELSGPGDLGVAVLFALSSVPTFLWLRERALPQSAGLPRGWVADTFARLGETLRRAQDFADLRRLLVCIVFYQAGIQAVITLAAVYAQEAMKFTTQQTLVLIVVVNLMAPVGAFAFGYLQDRLGHIRSIALTLVGWIAMILLAWSANGASRFWAAAVLAGICLGASQSAARAAVAVLSPATRRGEFFGLWGLAVKLSSIVGPLTYGLVTWLTDGDHRLAILATGSYFVVGLLLLSGIDLERGRRAAQAAG